MKFKLMIHVATNGGPEYNGDEFFVISSMQNSCQTM